MSSSSPDKDVLATEQREKYRDENAIAEVNESSASSESRKFVEKLNVNNTTAFATNALNTKVNTTAEISPKALKTPKLNKKAS